MTSIGSPLRILHVDKFGSRAGGGAPGYMLDLVLAQRELGHHVEFLATDGPTDVPTRYRSAFPPRISLAPPPSGVSEQVATAATMVWSRRAAKAMSAILDDFRPDVVHCHNLYHQLSPSVLRPVAKRGIPAVMTVHDYKLVCPTYRLIDGAGRHCERCVEGGVTNVVRRRCQGGSRMQSAVLMAESGLHRLLGAYDPIAAFLCPSQYLADLFDRAGHGDRVRHVPYGCELSDVEPRTEPGRGVLYGGRLSPEKGVDLLISAVARLEDTTLTICGDGPSRPALEAQAAEMLGSRARFLGHVARSELLRRVAETGVVAAPSVWAENQPLMILDAMACGVPVVSGDAPALREMVRPGISGSTVDPRDIGAFAAALAFYEADPDAQRTIMETAPAALSATHDMGRHLHLLDELYRSFSPGDPSTEAVERHG